MMFFFHVSPVKYVYFGYPIHVSFRGCIYVVRFFVVALDHLSEPGCNLPVDSFDHLDPLDTAETFLVARHCVI